MPKKRHKTKSQKNHQAQNKAGPEAKEWASFFYSLYCQKKLNEERKR